jgi:hypothetical protein
MVNWISELQPTEWPEGVIENMDPKILTAAVDLRTESGVAMTPSPIFEGHVRKIGNSRHSINNGKRLSDATDFFVKSDVSSIYKVIQAIHRIHEITGWGIYFDTKPSVMFHIDCRPNILNWIRVSKEYIYAVNDPSMYYEELSKQLEKLRR